MAAWVLVLLLSDPTAGTHSATAMPGLTQQACERMAEGLKARAAKDGLVAVVECRKVGA